MISRKSAIAGLERAVNAIGQKFSEEIGASEETEHYKILLTNIAINGKLSDNDFQAIQAAVRVANYYADVDADLIQVPSYVSQATVRAEDLAILLSGVAGVPVDFSEPGTPWWMWGIGLVAVGAAVYVIKTKRDNNAGN